MYKVQYTTIRKHLKGSKLKTINAKILCSGDSMWGFTAQQACRVINVQWEYLEVA